MPDEQKKAIGKDHVGPVSPIDATIKIYNTVPKHPGHAHRTAQKGYDD